MPDYPGAIEMYVDRSRVFIDASPHFAIVLHKTAGGSSAQNIASFFANDPNMASTHYVVGEDGAVVQCVREVDGAAGNCCLEAGHDSFWDQVMVPNLNYVTFSIESVDPSTNNDTPMPQSQKDALFALVKYLVDKYHIQPDHIKGHNSIAPINRRNCPGPVFPWGELMDYLKGGTMLDISQVSGFFTDNGNGQWKCKQNGLIVGGAILDAYRSVRGLGALNGVSDWGLPKTGEMTYPQFLQYLKDHGDVSQSPKPGVRPEVRFQEFEGRFVCYEPYPHVYDDPPGSGDVYRVHLPSVQTTPSNIPPDVKPSLIQAASIIQHVLGEV